MVNVSSVNLRSGEIVSRICRSEGIDGAMLDWSDENDELESCMRKKRKKNEEEATTQKLSAYFGGHPEVNECRKVQIFIYTLKNRFF